MKANKEEIKNEILMRAEGNYHVGITMDNLDEAVNSIAAIIDVSYRKGRA